MPRIDPHSDRPRYLQLADILRARIASGRLSPGDRLPSLYDLQEEHGLGRNTVRQSFAVLRSEGLVETLVGVGLVVRDREHTEVVEVRPGDRVTTRMPTPVERRELGIPEGVPVLVVDRADGATEVHAGDRTAIEAVGDDG